MLGIFLDSETNGLSPLKHRMFEIAFKIVDVKTGECLREYQTVVKQPFEIFEMSDPTSLSINGFTWELISKGKTTELIAEEIIDIFHEMGIKRGQAVFICQNPSFDRAFFAQLIDPEVQEKLQWPYHWLDLASMYWAVSLKDQNFPWKTGFSKDKIAHFYHLPSEQKPHRAMRGVEHLLQCYEAVVGFKQGSLLK